MDPKNNVELTDIFATYAKELPTRLQEVATLWKQLEQQWDQETVIEFSRKIHNLCGTAGVFGFDEVSQVANNIQSILRSSPDVNQLSSDYKKSISLLVVQLMTLSEACKGTMRSA